MYHSTADLYYDATTQTLGGVTPATSTILCYETGVYFIIHPRVYEISRVHVFCTQWHTPGPTRAQALVNLSIALHKHDFGYRYNTS